jgi:hypothetical protein
MLKRNSIIHTGAENSGNVDATKAHYGVDLTGKIERVLTIVKLTDLK